MLSAASRIVYAPIACIECYLFLAPVSMVFSKNSLMSAPTYICHRQISEYPLFNAIFGQLYLNHSPFTHIHLSLLPHHSTDLGASCLYRVYPHRHRSGNVVDARHHQTIQIRRHRRQDVVSARRLTRNAWMAVLKNCVTFCVGWLAGTLQYV